MTIRDRIVELRRVPAGELIANPKNWRRHPEPQRNALQAVLAEVGIADALLARETPEGLVLIDGHLRTETMPDEVLPVLILDVTEEEADKLLLTIDPLAAMAEADAGLLRSLLEGVEWAAGDGINDLLRDLSHQADGAEPNAGKTDPDEVPPLPKKPLAKRGEVWLLGSHRVMCGDSTDEGDVGCLMAGETARLMVTDPPYGVDYASLVAFRPNQKKGGWSDITGDALDDEQMTSLLRGALGGAGADVAFVWHPAGARRFIFWEALESNDFHILQEIVWVKNALIFGMADYQWRHEPCLYAKRNGVPRGQSNRTETTVWEVDKPTDSQHPTQKPTELYERPLRNHTEIGEILYDPFLGSGTGVIACERLGRRCYGMEIEPRYVDVAVKRWEAYTGKKATKEKRVP